MKYKNCQECGTENLNTAILCGGCGSRFNDNPKIWNKPFSKADAEFIKKEIDKIKSGLTKRGNYRERD